MKPIKVFQFRGLRVYKGQDTVWFEIAQGHSRLTEYLWIMDEVPELVQILLDYLVDEIPKTVAELEENLASLKKQYAELEKEADKDPQAEMQLREISKEILRHDRDIEFLKSLKEEIVQMWAKLEHLARI